MAWIGHRFDYDTPIEETMQALHDVVQAGYVRYIGMSSCYAYQCKPQPYRFLSASADVCCSPRHAEYVRRNGDQVTQLIVCQTMQSTTS